MSGSLQPLGLYSPWNSPGQNTGVGSLFPSPGYLPNPGIEPRSPALHVDSLPAEPQGKPKITGVGSLSLLQGIFPTQESNQGLLHCRWILYKLSYEGSPRRLVKCSTLQKKEPRFMGMQDTDTALPGITIFSPQRTLHWCCVLCLSRKLIQHEIESSLLILLFA